MADEIVIERLDAVKSEVFDKAKCRMKKIIIFRWLFPGIYVAALLILVLGNMSGAGHTPHALQFLVYVISAPCYLFDLLLPRGWIHNLLLGLILCVVFGFLTCAFVGFLIDIALQKYRQRHV